MASVTFCLKRLLFLSSIGLGLFILLEGAGHVAYRVRYGQFYSFREWNTKIAAAARATAAAGKADAGDAGLRRQGRLVEVVHPYIGFVADPEFSRSASPMGFFNTHENLLWRDDPAIRKIVILGGSFAMGVALSGDQTLNTAMENRGFNTRILNHAIAGYKQPQQLFVLTYLLAHGADIDAVVNIDGFNEVALPPQENLPVGTNPFYPRAWRQRMTGIYDQSVQRLVGRILFVEDQRTRWARICSGMPCFSMLRGMIWMAVDNRFQAAINSFHQEIAERSDPDSAGFLESGPSMLFADDQALYSAEAQMWMNCSLLINSLCRANDIVYLHVLQPNQYDPGSKPMSELELSRAVNIEHPYRLSVETGYPLLRDASEKLRAAGVQFLDLTRVYQDHPEPLYVDFCCHTDHRGYQIIAEKIAEELADLFIESSSTGGSDFERRDTPGMGRDHLNWRSEEINKRNTQLLNGYPNSLRSK